MKLSVISSLVLTAAAASVPVAFDFGPGIKAPDDRAVQPVAEQDEDSTRYTRLTAEDYSAVAGELGISVACIKAVVEIETGNKGEGFGPDSLPLINFDLAMFRKYARLRGVDLTQYHKTHPIVFNKLDLKRYSNKQAAQYARLRAAMEIDTVAALEGTFWGMFQIGGFNWKLCGCESVGAFASRMAYSEREQLELFAAYVKARNLQRFLVKLDWAAFALRYNGPGFKKLKYDTRMASAYRKYSQ